MNLECEKVNNPENTKRQLFDLNQVVGLCLDTYLTNGEFVSREIGQELREKSIPKLLKTTINAFSEGNIVQMGGSAMEILSDLMTEQEYWKTKKEMKKMAQKMEGVELNGERAMTVMTAIKRLGKGDPDFDFYLSERKNLKDFFDNFYKSDGDNAKINETESGGKIFETKISENINLDVYWGPVYKNSLFDRVQLQLKGLDNNPLFHVDITALPETSDEAVQNRRQYVGSIHDNCRGKIEIVDNKVQIYLNSGKIPKAEEASEMNLRRSERDPVTFFEVVLRELRKKGMHYTSDNNPKRHFFELSNIYPLLQVEDIFTLRELFFGDNNLGNKIYEAQSPYQKEMIYQEWFLIAQTDPFLAIIMLQDLGLDALFLNRHLTRKEVLSILSSPHLNFAPENIDGNRKERVSKSREKYINNRKENGSRNGLSGLIAAIGQTLGKSEDINNYQVHLEKGWKIIANPKTEIKELPNLTLKDGLKEEEKEVLDQLLLGGGLTEKGWHHVMNMINKNKYPNNSENDKRKFRHILLKLKKDGLVEAAKRKLVIEGKEMEVWFYYPCVASTKIRDILYDAGISKIKSGIIDNAYKLMGIESLEAVLSIRPKELKGEGVWETMMSILHRDLSLYLIRLQQKNEKNLGAHTYLDFRKNN